jgi:hypothetical protein
MTRWIVLTIACAGVLAYGLIVHVFWSRAGDVRVAIAARQMPFNHLLEAKDFRGSQDQRLSGSYLMMNVVPGEIVTGREVSPTPLLATDPNPLLSISVPEADAHGGGLEPKSKGQICDGSKAVAAAETVALLCSGTSGEPACAVLVRVAPGDAGKLVGLASLDHVLFKPACK